MIEARDDSCRMPPLLGAGIVVAFAAILLARTLAHDMWRDELQAWLIARGSASVGEMLHHMRYEGHPPLWHLLLYALSRVTGDPRAMQVLHVAIATATVGVVAWRAPFSPLARALFALGYYPFFEYASISRCYALGLLCVVVFCAVWDARPRRRIALAVVLALLVQTSIYGILLAFALGCVALVDALAARRAGGPDAPSWGRLAVAAAIVLASLALAVAVIKPAPDAFYPWIKTEGIGLDRGLKRMGVTIWQGMFPIPSPGEEFWNSNIVGPRSLRRLLSAAVFAFTALLFLGRRDAAAAHLSGTLGLLAFAVAYTGWVRHYGHHFVLAAAAFWLAARSPALALPEGRVARWARALDGRRMSILTALLALHAALGVHAALEEARTPFSAGRLAADWIRANAPDAPVVGHSDEMTMPLAGYLGRPVHFARTRRDGTFVLWSRARAADPSNAEVFAYAGQVAREAGRPAVLVLDRESAREGVPPGATPVAEFPVSIVGSECYRLFLVPPGRAP